MAEKLTIVVDLDSKQVETGLNKVERRVKKTGGKLRKGFGQVAKVGAGAMAAFGIGAAKAASDAETSFAKLQTIAGKDIGKLKKQIMGMPPELGSVGDAAEAAYQAISASVKPAKAVEFVKQAALAAKGGFTDMTTAVDSATTIMNSYGAAAGDSSAIFDKFLKAQNLGKTTFGELGNSIGDVAATAKDFGVPFDNLLGMIAQLTASGIKTPKAVTGIRAAISNLAKPTKDAQAALQGLGFSVVKMVEQADGSMLESVTFDPGKFKQFISKNGMVGLIKKIKTESQDASQSFTNIFGSVEAATAIKTMAGNLEETQAKIKGISGASGDAAKAAGVMMGTTGEQFKALGASLERVMIGVGEDLLPQIKGLTKLINDEMGSIKTVASGVGAVITTIAKGIVFITKGLAAASSAAKGLVSGNGAGVESALGLETKETSSMNERLSNLADIPGRLGRKGIKNLYGNLFGYNLGPKATLVQGLARGGLVQGFPDGGLVSGAGTSKSDSIPANLSNGEFVMQASAVKAYGVGTMEAMNGIAGGTSNSGTMEERMASLKERVRAVFAQGSSEGVSEGASQGMGSPKGSGAAGQIFKGTSASFMDAIAKGAKDGSVKDAVKGFAKGLGDAVKEKMINSLKESMGKKLLSMFTGGLGGFFAEGGRPPVGMPSVVGEEGPELFVPDRPGTVLPNGTGLGGGLSFSIGQLTVGAGATPDMAKQTAMQIAEELSDMLDRGALPGLARRMVEQGTA